MSDEKPRGVRPDPPGSLREVRAAQLRAVAIRWALGKSALGMVFLLGATAHAMAPDPRAASASMWMALLLVLSTVHVGLGLRTLARVRRRGPLIWMSATVAFGLAATVMLRLMTTSTTGP